MQRPVGGFRPGLGGGGFRGGGFRRRWSINARRRPCTAPRLFPRRRMRRRP